MKASPGLSVTELLVAVSLFGIIIGGVAQLQATAARGESSALARTLTDQGALALEAALRKALEDATYIESPAAGSSGTELIVWANVDPSSPGFPALVSAPAGQPDSRTYSRFCLNQGRVFLYEGRLDATWPQVFPACGAAARESPLVLAGSSTGQPAAAVWFLRPAQERNLVVVDYQLSMPATAVSRGAVVARSATLGMQAAR